jgi:hypothetical protein
MAERLVTFVMLSVGLAMGTAHAQECLHGPNESAEQVARRRDALLATRTINNIQANQPGAARGQYLRYEELSGTRWALTMRQSSDATAKRISLDPGTEILPGWKLTLDVSPSGYWFMIQDTADPCKFAFISNHAGVIFKAEPIR